MTLNELLYESLKSDEHFLAYSIYWAIQEGLVKGSDRFETLKNINLDTVKINELRERNVLNVKEIKLYSMPMETNQYLFVFAENESDARGVYMQQFSKLPKSIGDMTSRMDFEMWSEEEGYKTFREMKDEILHFPSVALVYERDDRPVEVVEHEYYLMFGKELRELKG